MTDRVVLVCGDRFWSDHTPIHKALAHFRGLGFSVLIHGAAPGADSIAGEIGELLGYAVRPYPAPWRKLGKAAGPVRNRQMLAENPDIELVLAFHDNLYSESKGTKDMVTISQKPGVTVLHYSHESNWAKIA